MLLLIALLPGPTTAQANDTPTAQTIELGEAVVPLDGPWKFHTGDNLQWADPAFDDSTWESVNLKSSADAHDPDVGLTRYVPGWQARGHRGHSGYAWYRAHLSVVAPQGEALQLCAPFYVDNAFQIFVDGHLLAGAGDFSGQPPVARNSHLPRIFSLPGPFGNPRSVIAIRVWMDPWLLADPEAGGIHIAPELGTARGVAACYQREWIELRRGYVVDAVEALAFLLLAVMAWSVRVFDRSNPGCLWLAGALVVIALARGNQAVLFWWDFETLHEFQLATIVLLVPLSLGAWTLAWSSYFQIRDRVLRPGVVGALTIVVATLQFLRRSWFYGVFPQWLELTMTLLFRSARWLFVLLMALIIFRLASRPGREKWVALPAVLLMSVGLFTPELTTLHVPSIWFPYGVGVSLSEYSFAAFDLALFVMFLRVPRSRLSGES
jgi:hypothetical protein